MTESFIPMDQATLSSTPDFSVKELKKSTEPDKKEVWCLMSSKLQSIVHQISFGNEYVFCKLLDLDMILWVGSYYKYLYNMFLDNQYRYHSGSC